MHLTVSDNYNQALSSILLGRSAGISICNSKAQTPLHLASAAGDAAIVRELLSAGVSIAVLDTKGLTPLPYAVRSKMCSAAVVELFLDRHDMIRSNPCLQTDGAGRNLLHHHVKSSECSEDILRIILDNGADVNQIHIKGHSPFSLYLWVPRFRLKASICQLCLDRGASPLWSDREGEKPSSYILMCYTRLTLPDQVLRILEDSGVNMTAKHFNERSILHHGAIAGSISQGIIDLLQECGLSGLQHPDRHGRTPLSYVEEGAQRPRGILVECDFESSLKIPMKAGEDFAGYPST